MSLYSTSKILGKLSDRQNKTESDEFLNQKTEKEDLAVPQLTPSNEPKMKNILSQILGASFTKKRSPMDK